MHSYFVLLFRTVLLRTVLILVLMEDALVQKKSGRRSKSRKVLILVLMEDALVRYRFACRMFSKRAVLILVLMEDALVRNTILATGEYDQVS